MNKTTAIETFGEKIVKKAMEMYETDFGKVFFEEDCRFENDCSAPPNEVLEYLYRAKRIVSK